MYYLKDNNTEKVYEISSSKMFFARAIPVVSLVLYGTILALALSIFEISIPASIALLVAAYAIEVILLFSNKCSFGNFIGAVLLLVSWRGIVYQILESNNKKMTSGKITQVVNIYKSCENNAMFSI